MNLDDDARVAAQNAARDSYSRLLAIVVSRTRNISAAEDALSEAFAIALQVWPERGVPDNPESWLVVTARRAAGHVQRHDLVRTNAQATLKMLQDEMNDNPQTPVPDKRLGLLFVCAHPAIAPEIRTPLMLQTVFGLDAERIGRVFLTKGPTMGQRLSRAKSKISAANIPFTVPDPAEWPDRLEDVLTAIYAAFHVGWDDLPDFAQGGEDFVEEALYLARLASNLMPDEPEPLGLLALMLHCEARRPARRGDDGAFIPLGDQDPALWRADLIEAAEECLARAAAMKKPGRFQTEAAIQSIHAARHRGLSDLGEPLMRLYDVLAHQTQSIGAAVSRAAAHAEYGVAQDAWAILQNIPQPIAESYQSYWVVRAKIATQLGMLDDASVSLRRAMALTTDPAISAFLQKQIDALPFQ